MKKNVSILLAFFLCSFSLVGCVDDQAANKEEVRFLLDERNYEAAITKAREAVAADSSDTEARSLLASALLGQSVFSGSDNCEEGDTGPLGLLACLIDEQDNNENELETFVRIAPEADQLDNLAEARALLVDLTQEITQADLLQGTFLRLYVARLFEIAGVMTRIGMTSDNDECNRCLNDEAGCVNDMKDEVPDSFNANALDEPENEGAEEQFSENLNNVNDDGQNAGLPSDFSLSSRIITIVNEVQDAGALSLYFEIQFNDNPLEADDRSTCDEAL